MIKRRKILLFLCLAISVLSIPQVRATEINFNTSDNSPGSGESGGNGQYSQWIYFNKGSKKIKYRYSVEYSSNTNYNIRNNSPYGDTIKAGTWMGINIHEIQSASWKVIDIEYKEIKKVYICSIQAPTNEICHCYWAYDPKASRVVQVCPGSPNYNKTGHCTWQSNTIDIIKNEEHDYYDPSPCPAGSIEKVDDKKEVDIETKEKNQEVYGLAHNRALGMVGAPLSKLQIITDELDEKSERKTETILGQLVSSSDSGAGESGSVSKTYSYKPNNICINLKTGKVRYNKECEQDEEVKINPYISEEIEYWQYFSPLDTKSGTNFSLIIKNNIDRKLSDKECHSIMDNYKSQYQNYIVSINNKALKGDYCKNGNCNNLNTGSGSDWQEVSKGCYFSTVVNFDVIQKYYFEEMKNNELKFNGYNLYYRPININNPFPTTPTENSIWYEWFNSTNKTPNLKDSFNEVTYSVAVPNKLADTIRAYNVNNPYPSFDKLSLNGTSSFLQSIGVVSLTEDKVNKLGEGTKTCIKNGKVSIGSDCS